MTADAEVAAAAEESSSGIAIIGMVLSIIVWGGIIGLIVFLVRRNKTESKGIVHPIGERSKWVAAILAFFLGGFGIHRYYLGYKKQGIMQSCSILGLIIGYSCLFSGDGIVIAIPCLLYSAAMGIWAIIDFVCILTGSLIPIDGVPYKENQVPQVRVNNSSASDSADAIAKLAKLPEQGILSDEEFQQKKTDLLAKM